MSTATPFPLPWSPLFARQAAAAKARGAVVLELMQTRLPETQPEPRLLIIPRAPNPDGNAQ